MRALVGFSHQAVVGGCHEEPGGEDEHKAPPMDALDGDGPWGGEGLLVAFDAVKDGAVTGLGADDDFDASEMTGVSELRRVVGRGSPAPLPPA